MDRDFEDAMWSEAAAVVRSEEDSLIQVQARGLVVAEMSSVTLADRLQALGPGQALQVRTVRGALVCGTAEASAADHVLIAGERCLHLIPTQAIATISSLPRVLHPETTSPQSTFVHASTSWRRVLRGFFGHRITIDVATTVGDGEGLAGTLTWVGQDHLTVLVLQREVTVPWRSVVDVRLPRLAHDQDSDID
jgi:hypothetical protein